MRSTSDTAALAIRPATAEDVPALGRLGALLVRTHHAFDPERFISATPETEAGYGAFLASQIGRRGAIVLVAAVGDAVVGYAYGCVEGPDYMALRGPAGVFHDLAVDPDYRRRGAGQALFDAMLARLQSGRTPRIVLSVAERNEAAQRLFARAGFRRTMVEMTRESDRDAL